MGYVSVFPKFYMYSFIIYLLFKNFFWLCPWHTEVPWPVRKLLSFLIFFFLLGLHLQHMEVPRLGVKSELHLLAYTTTAATPDLSHICNLYHSSQQHWIFNPLSKARDQTHFLMDTSQIRFHCAKDRSSLSFLIFKEIIK